MWPKFGNSSISVREVIITSILYRFDQKNCSFWRMVLVQAHYLGTGTNYKLEILYHCGKRIETKSQRKNW